MTSLNTKNICFLAAFLFLSIVPTLAAVGNTVADCDQFLPQVAPPIIAGEPPHIPDMPPHIAGILENGQINNNNNNRYRIICQVYGGQLRYLTVYDILNRIPVFSAYSYPMVSPDGRPEETWMIEPRLEDGADQDDINMRAPTEGTVYVNQAVDADYRRNTNTGTQILYTRGHLFPSLHAQNNDDKISTFTLTNIAPQSNTFNEGKWVKVESCTRCLMNWYITNKQMQCFVVVGAIPGNSNLNDLPNDDPRRVNIPSMFWSAFYCRDNNNAFGGAHWGDHDANNDQNLALRRLGDLNAELNQRYNVENSNVFPNREIYFIRPNMKSFKGCRNTCSAQPEASSSVIPK